MELFSHCLNPKRIFNKYTKHFEYVACKECYACKNSEASVISARVSNEIKQHRYSLFFTLTYDNNSIPRFEVFSDSMGRNQIRPVGRLVDSYTSYPLSYNRPSDNRKLLNLTDSYIPHIENYEVLNEFAVCSKTDVQNFIKRLRYKISKLPYNEKEKKIRYFICSEYGPKTLRPHYHGIIFFDSEKLLTPLQDGIVSSWGRFVRQIGERNLFEFVPFASVSLTRAHIKLCDANTSYYVADYVAGNDCLPQVLRHPLTRPFKLCSQNPIIGSYKVDKTSMLEDVHRGTIKHDLQVMDKAQESVSFVSVPYSKSDLSTVFRKCAGFRTLSSYAKSLIYSFVHDHAERYAEYFERQYTLSGCPTCENFLRLNRDMSLRNYLLTYHHDMYVGLGMDDDATWFASLHCHRMIERYPIFSHIGFASAVDGYLHLMHRAFTLKDVTKMHDFADNLNLWLECKGIGSYFAAYPFLGEHLPILRKYYYTVPKEYKHFIDKVGLAPLLYDKSGVLNRHFVDTNNELNSIEFVQYYDECLSKYNRRSKSKKANNSVLGNYRKMD